MRRTKEMMGLWGWLDGKGHPGSKNTNKPRNKQLAHMQRESRKRNWRVK